MLEIVILVVSVLASASIGLFVFARNPNSLTNKLYALLTLTLVLFPILNYFSLHTTNRLLFIRAVITVTSVSVVSLYFMVVSMGTVRTKRSTVQKYGLLLTALVVLIDPTRLVFSGLTTGSNPAPVPNIGALLFIAHLITFPAISIIILFRRLRNTTGTERIQNLYVLYGITPIFLFAPVTSFLLPVVMGNVSLIFLSPLYALIFVGLIGYAIVRHKLFDIRSFVVRAMAYLITVVLMSVGFFMPILYVLTKLFHLQPSLLKLFGLTFICLIITYAYGLVKKALDGVTSRIFFRNEYDPESFIGELNKAVVSTLDLDVLLRNASKVIADNFKLEYCVFGLKETDNSGQVIIGTSSKHFSEENIDYVRKITPRLREQVIITDLIPAEHYDLQKILLANDISLLARLITNKSKQKEGLGYIILGPKKSGQQFNSRDTRTITTIIDGLIVAIQNAVRFKEIELFNITLQEKVDDATRKLRRTNEKLKQLDETKDDFISMASHQLRTPLTSVKGYISMVLEEDAGKITATQRDMLGQAFFGSQRMVYLIADLLNVSRLKTGKFIMEPTKINLVTMIEQEMSQLRETAAARELTLRFDKPDKFPDTMLDETKTRQVIMNFIDNAIYYTPAGGRIRILLSETASTIEMRVEDDGIGVPKAEQSHLFTKFYRAGNARHARPDGTGLGLFMAKKVILGQGGSVLFDSEEGKGSMFGFVFSKRAVGIDTAVEVLPPVSKSS